MSGCLCIWISLPQVLCKMPHRVQGAIKRSKPQASVSCRQLPSQKPGPPLGHPLAHLAPSSNLPLIPSSPSTTLQATEPLFPGPTAPASCRPSCLHPCPPLLTRSAPHSRESFLKSKGGVPALFLSGRGPKLSLQSAGPLEDLVPARPSSHSLHKPSSTLLDFLK